MANHENHENENQFHENQSLFKAIVFVHLHYIMDSSATK